LYQEPFFTLFDRKSISFEFYGKCEISQKKIFKVKNKYLTDAYEIAIRAARFVWYYIPKWGIVYQITIKYTKWP
jgi:hypothetical protein